MSEPAKPPEEPDRVRVTFDCGLELHKSALILAAHQNLSLAALAREALAQLVERSTLLVDEAEVGVAKGDTLREKKRKFLAAVERRYYPILAARLCKLRLQDVESWADKDKAFAQQIDEAQLFFICSLEMRQISRLRTGKKNAKDAYLFWQSFQNAHNPNHGRFKADAAAREFRGFIDEAFKIIERDLTTSQAKKTIEKIQAMAERRLGKLGD